MITSIVQLPEFAVPGTVLHGLRYGGLYPQEYIHDVQFIQTCGRDLSISHDLYKYKLRVVEPYGRSFDVVMATSGPIHQYSIIDGDLAVYPIYAREVTHGGFSSQYLSPIILNIENINRLFAEKLYLPGVTSLMSVMTHGIGSYISEVEHIPSNVLDKDYDPNYATLAPIRDDFIENFIGGGSTARDMLKDDVSKSCVLYGYVPMVTQKVLNAKCLGEITPLIDMYHASSMIELMVNSAAGNYNWYYSMINNKHPPYEHVYTTDDRSCNMDRLIYVATMMGSADFSIEFEDIRNSNCATRWKVFNVERADIDVSFRDTSYMAYAMREFLAPNIAWPTDGYVKVVGSYLEDMWVSDRNGEVISYFDLFWWILTSGAGLINISSAYI